MKTKKSLGYLFAACIATSLAACGGGDSPSPAPAPTPSPGPSPTPAPPPPAPSPSPTPPPVSSAPFYLAGEAGARVNGTFTFASGTSQIPVGNLVLVDPASPTTPTTVETAGTFVYVGLIPDGTVTGGVVTDVYYRYVVYLKNDRVWTLDLAKSGSQTPVQLSTQALSGANGVCEDSAKVYYALPASNSTIVYDSPGPNGLCGDADDVHKAVKIGTGPTIAPTVIPGEVLDAIYNPSGNITGFVVRSYNAPNYTGGTLRHFDANFTSSSLIRTLATTASPTDVMYSIGTAGGTLPGYMVYTETADPQGGALKPQHIRVVDLATGNEPANPLMTLNAVDNVVDIGNDATHYYFGVNIGGGAREIRRVATASLPTATELVVSEAASTPPIVEGQLTTNRVYYNTQPATAGLGFLRSTPKGVNTTPRTDQPTSAQYHIFAWGTSGTTLWRTDGDFSLNPNGLFHSRASAEDRSNLFNDINGAIGGFLLTNALSPSASPFAGVLIGEKTTTITLPSPYSGTTLKLYDGATGNVLVTYGTLASVSYQTISAPLLRSDAPALITAESPAGLGVVDLYFVNGLNAGLTRITSNVTSAPLPPYAPTTSLFRPLSGTKTLSGFKVASRGLTAPLASAQTTRR